MSEPVKNAEVEDVLSSIRRLVSEDKRPIQKTAPAPVSDRLVLTPDHRVIDDAPILQPEKQAVLPEKEDLQDGSADNVLSEPDPSEMDVSDMDQPTATVVDDEAQPAIAVSLTDQPVLDSDAGQDVLLNYEDDYNDDPYDFSDFSNEVKKDPEDIAQVVEPAEDVAPEDVEQTIEPTDDRPKADTASATATKAATLSAKIEALETVIGKISDDWEPDGAGQDVYAGAEQPAMAWEDDSGDGADEPPQAATVLVEDVQFEDDTSLVPEDSPAPDGGDSFDQDGVDSSLPSDDHLIDEDTLRDLISTIVREELQGALGEKITRNVRKLVRREIHRALTARDIE